MTTEAHAASSHLTSNKSGVPVISAWFLLSACNWFDKKWVRGPFTLRLILIANESFLYFCKTKRMPLEISMSACLWRKTKKLKSLHLVRKLIIWTINDGLMERCFRQMKSSRDSQPRAELSDECEWRVIHHPADTLQLPWQRLYSFQRNH